MSKFLKFIIHLIILLAILNVLALAVPPFMGITTAIIDSKTTESNLPLGSVTYAESTSVNELAVGDSILTQDGNAVYRYKIQSIDTSNGVYNVVDATDSGAQEEALALKNTAQKVIITIGFIGYLVIATQSMEGMIIIGLVILFLIILFILAELWRKDKRSLNQGELEGAEDAADGVEMAEGEAPTMTKRELKKAAKERARQEKEEAKLRDKQELAEATKQLKEEAKARKKEEKKRKKQAKKIARTGGFIEDYEPIEAALDLNDKSVHENLATEDANRILQEEVAAATAAQAQADTGETHEVVLPKEEAQEPREAAAPSQEAEVAALEAEVQEAPQAQPELAAEPEAEVQAAPEPEAEMPQVESVQEPEPVELKKMAVPVYTAEELLSKAQAAGDTPQVLRDEKTGITLLDYSTIILEETPTEE